MVSVKVRLQPLVSRINLPTVLKTAILPGDTRERLFIATQVGEIFYIGNEEIVNFLDIRSRVIQLGTNGGYDERGLLGLAFHPNFTSNGLFYIHYSLAGTQGPGALPDPFEPEPCDPKTQNLQWTNREANYDHIDTVEEWIVQTNGKSMKRRTLLNLRRPFMNHNGVNSLTFSPETGRLVLTTGDGGSGFDPFNLAQNDMEIAGKIIEMDIQRNLQTTNPPIVTRFDELPPSMQETLTVIVKGVRNIPGISYQRLANHYIKYVGQVGQELVESIYSFIHYHPVRVSQLVQAYTNQSQPKIRGIVNLGWRGWEGNFPTPIIRECTNNPEITQKITAYYEEAVALSGNHIQPLTSYFHEDPRPDKFAGTALTGVQAYMGTSIPGLTGNVVFTDFVKKASTPARGALAYTSARADGSQSDFHEIQIDHDFGSESSYYVCLGANLNQSKLFLGTYRTSNVTDLNQGRIFEIIP
ncbi:PQQ-dependent sugar dehydrogenase [Ornithinibacillus halotolerans]|uniref:Glucose dehydrogenase n=1 Tax=Ornithinibacillus halotolerans TaxID=1274357 RepID=A0A916WEF6_9BACI|nr:PQQ-dependent sugar dehydrogenase [Ornithinibacillus halotolerans]GGA91885.1 glucose dehydrogenase [Ornithinibacillus halotolerans]